VLPPLRYRNVYADTAQKTADANDYSVFQCWGKGKDGKAYLIDVERGKWPAPELKRRAKRFWAAHRGQDETLRRIGKRRGLSEASALRLSPFVRGPSCLSMDFERNRYAVGRTGWPRGGGGGG